MYELIAKLVCDEMNIRRCIKKYSGTKTKKLTAQQNNYKFKV